MNNKFKQYIHTLTHIPALESALIRRLRIPYLLSDENTVRLWWWVTFHKKLNLKHPNGFGEKLQWLKLNNRKEEYHTWVDKFRVKEYVASCIGEEYVIPTLGVWDNWDDVVKAIPTLPHKFVLKTTHGSGGSGVVICKDINQLNIEWARKRLERSMKKDDDKLHAEWPYRGIKKRFLAEPYLEDSSGELRDYKFFCFNGKVRCFKIDFGRMVEHHANYYDCDGALLPFGEVDYMPDFYANVFLPTKKDEMIHLAEKLSKDQPFLRVDFYEVNGKVYFGEITFYPASGLSCWTTEDADSILGDWLDLSSIKK